MEVIPFEAEAHLDWLALTRAIEAGHKLPRAQVEDVLIYRGEQTLLNRSAWIDGMGVAVKACTIFPGQNPMVNGAVNLFSDSTGTLEAVVDFHLVTKWKTAGDSLLAALKLARKDSRKFLIVGAGTVGQSMVQAYSAAFAGAEFCIWNRSPGGAEAFAEETGAKVVHDLEAAVREADVVTCATMARDPVIAGEWLQAGQHLNLIGAYRPDMREADDLAMSRSKVFVDSRETTVAHIGELIAPIASGAIGEADVLADYYQMDGFQRKSDDEITLFKNGGGAHLDLMVSRYILEAWRAR